MFTTVVCATDGSERADRALEYAVEVAEEANGDLHIVHVVERLLGGRSAGLYTMPNQDQINARVQTRAQEITARHSITPTVHLIAGDGGHVANHIAAVAAELGADLIVVGTHGHGVVGTLMLGSVTQQLLHVASCPVLAVPPKVPSTTTSPSSAS